MAPKWLFVTVLLVLQIDTSICTNESTESPNSLGNDLIETIFSSESTIHMCSQYLSESDDFFMNCDNDYTVPGDNTISEKTCWVAPSHLMSENIPSKFSLSTKDLPSTCTVSLLNLPLNESLESEGKFLRNGYFQFYEQFYHMEEFCINGVDANQSLLQVKICQPNCEERTCIQKCCEMDKVFSFGMSPNPEGDPNLNRGCVRPGNELFQPPVYHNSRERISEKESRNLPGIHYTKNYHASFKYDCPNNRTLFFTSNYVAENIHLMTNRTFHHLMFRIQKDGRIVFRGNSGSCEVLDPKKHHFCVDGVVNFDPDGLKYRNSEDTLILFLCSEPAKTETDPSLAYGYMMLFSCIFLALTVIVYGLLWERQTVHGWTIVTHIVCLCFMYVFVGTGHLLRSSYGVAIHFTAECIFVGFAAHFFTIATFQWLALISVDLFFTFRAITPRSDRSKGWSRYIKYSIFGWGIPIIIVTTGLIIDGKHTEDDCMDMLSPGYGAESCYIQEKAMGLYMYLPLGILLFCNLLLFGITTTKLYQFRESTKMATKDDTQKQFYRLFVKLFFVMGILWIFEVISWAVSGVTAHWYWIFFDIINILRAIAVFFIFVCKPDIIKSLEQKYPCLRPFFVPCKRILFRKGKHSHKDHTTDESIGLNSSIRTTKSSILRMSDLET